MKKVIINITSLKRHTRVTIEKPGRRKAIHWFQDIEQAKEFVLPLGTPGTEMFLNGFPCVLHGWCRNEISETRGYSS